MLYTVKLEHAVARANDLFYAIYAELKAAAHHVGNLRVRVVVQRSLRALFKRVFHTHYILAVCKHPAGHPCAGCDRLCIRMEHPSVIQHIILLTRAYPLRA